ncbi:MAG: peptidoglycan editing factor PgeF [Acidobacteriaceae bacterium]
MPTTPRLSFRAERSEAEEPVFRVGRLDASSKATRFKEHSESTDEIDHLLASVGLRHGRRKLISAGFDRQPKHPRQLPPSPRRSSKTRVEVLRSPLFAQIPWLLGGFSARSGGVSSVYNPGQRAGALNLGFTPADSRENVLENRRRFYREVTGDPDFPAVTLRQVHSSLIRRVTASDAVPAEARLKGDGLLTSRPGLLLAIQTADCIPVLIADRKNRAVAAFHAGWRGTLKRIVESGVGRMRLEFGSKPQDLVAAIGPGIGQCCYSVGEEVRSEFLSQFAYAPELFRDVYDSDPVREKYPLLFLTARAPGHSNIGPSLHLDLAEANRRQLLDAGLSPEAISVQAHCTSCRTGLYFSHRAEHGHTGRMISAIGIRP